MERRLNTALLAVVAICAVVATARLWLAPAQAETGAVHCQSFYLDFQTSQKRALGEVEDHRSEMARLIASQRASGAMPVYFSSFPIPDKLTGDATGASQVVCFAREP